MKKTSKKIDVPVGVVDAVESLIRLYNNTPELTDYVNLNIAIAKTKWCQDRGDFVDRTEIKKVIAVMRREADILDNTPIGDPAHTQKWDESERLEKLIVEYQELAFHGVPCESICR